MTEKSKDKYGRVREVTVAFRMSQAESEEFDKRVRLCGYKKRQDFIIESVLHQRIIATGNPLMLVQFRKNLQRIEQELKRIDSMEAIDSELFTPLRTMQEILEAFEYQRKAGTP